MSTRHESAMNSAQSVSLLPILSVHFVGTLGFSIVLPFLVFMVTQWGGNALVYGVMGATYSAFQLIGAPILGRWSDSVGRRKILLLSQLGTLVSWVIFLVAMMLPVTTLFDVDSAWAGSFTLTVPLLVLFLARATDGITGGNVSVANAYLADVSHEENRNANFGKMAVATNLGFVVGPAVAGLLGSTPWGQFLPVVAALSISVVASLLIAFRLPESAPSVPDRTLAETQASKVFGMEPKDCIRMCAGGSASLRQVLGLPHMPLLMTIYFLVMLGFSFFYVSFPVRAVQGLGWSVGGTGTFFAVLSLLMVVVQGPVLTRASKLWKEPTLILWGSAILVVSFVAFTSESNALVYTAAALMALGNGLMWPSVLSVLSRVAGETYQGAVQGFAGSFGAVASIFGLLVGGVLYGWLGTWVFALAAGAVLVVFGLSWNVGESLRAGE